MAAAALPLRGHSAGRSFDNVDHWLEQVDKYADPHVQKVRAPQQRAPAALPADRRSACGVRVRGL